LTLLELVPRGLTHLFLIFNVITMSVCSTLVIIRRYGEYAVAGLLSVVVVQALGYGLIFFFQHVFTIAGVGIVVFLISWKLALIAIAVSPLLIAVAYRYSHVSHPLLRDVQQKMADVATVAEENIVGVHVVKAFAQEEEQQRKFERSSEEVFQLSVKANRQRAFYIPLLSFLPLLAQAAILLVGGRMVASGSLSVASFVRFNLYLAMLIMPLRALGMWIGQAQRATASGERIFQVIDEPEEIKDAPDARDLAPGPGRVTFSHATFGYDLERPVLSDVDLELEPGKVVALIGHTGAGKTTLASLVPRFYDVQTGGVAIDGQDVRTVKLASLRREIGVISQDPFLFSASVRDNIAFGRGDLPQEDVERAARAAGSATSRRDHGNIADRPQRGIAHARTVGICEIAILDFLHARETLLHDFHV